MLNYSVAELRNNNKLPMAAHGYDRKHRKEFWSKFIPKEAFKKQ